LSNNIRRDMSSAVARRRTSSVTTRAVGRAVEQVAGNAVVHAAKVEAGAYVAHVGMRYTEALTLQELQAAEMYPERAGRFKAIADGFTALVVNELQEMTYE
jgi:hypothetical protein